MIGKPKHTADSDDASYTSGQRLADIAEWVARASAAPGNKDDDGAWDGFGDVDLDACVADTRWLLAEIEKLKAENAALREVVDATNDVSVAHHNLHLHAGEYIEATGEIHSKGCPGDYEYCECECRRFGESLAKMAREVWRMQDKRAALAKVKP